MLSFFRGWQTPVLDLGSRAKKLLRMIPRGPQAQCAKIEPGQT